MRFTHADCRLCTEFNKEATNIPGASLREAFSILVSLGGVFAPLFGFIGLMLGLCLSTILGMSEALLTGARQVVPVAPVTLGLFSAQIAAVWIVIHQLRYPETSWRKEWIAPARLARLLVLTWWQHVRHFIATGGLHRLPQQERLPFPSVGRS